VHKRNGKRKRKKHFWIEMPDRLKQVDLHMEGKIELQDARDIFNEI
jgi:hypothetical protein